MGQNGMRSQNSRERERAESEHLTKVRNFEAATRFFQKQQYERAREIFEKLVNGSVTEVAERARVYLRVCERKLAHSTPVAKTATDYYTLGVAALNARNFDSAIKHLGRADKLKPNSEDIQYALAAAHALQGNTEAALEHLKTAIELRPENRFQARHDEDFESLAADPRFRSLIRPQVS